MRLFPQSYFVTGTDTNVGKTYISSALLRHFSDQGIKTIGMKPIASGCELDAQGEFMNQDVTTLIQASNLVAPIDLVNPYRFIPAIAPHIAAEQIDVEISVDVIHSAYQQLKALTDVIIVEGAGGFLVPINQNQTLADLALALEIPIIMVVGMRLGCINHALLTIEAIRSRGLELAGWIANQVDTDMAMFVENLETLQQRIAAPCLSVVRWQGSVTFN